MQSALTTTPTDIARFGIPFAPSSVPHLAPSDDDASAKPVTPQKTPLVTPPAPKTPMLAPPRINGAGAFWSGAVGPHSVVDARPVTPARSLDDALSAGEARLTKWLSGAGAPPSAQVAITYGGKLVYNKTFGVKNLETGEAATNDTLYQVNSMTKSLTAASIMQLVEAGKISLDTPVVSIVPEFARVRGGAALVNSITIKQLLTHSSLLSRDPALDVWNPDHFWRTQAWPSWDAIAERLDEAEVRPNPKHEMKYSNLGVATLGQVIERVSGEPYDQYVQEHIFAPLGMNDSHFKLSDADMARMAAGYSASRSVNGVMTRNAAPTLRDPGGMISAAGCRTTAADYAKWLSFLRDPASVAGVLTPASIAQMKSYAVLDDSNLVEMGLGIMSTNLSVGNPSFGHTGSGVGFSTAMRETSDGAFGVIVLTNDFSKQMNPPVDMYMRELADVAKPAPAAGAPPKDPAWASLLGNYVGNSNKITALKTTASGDLTIDGAVLAPVPGKADTFTVTNGDRTGDLYETVFFERDAQTGKVLHAIYGGTTLDNCQKEYPRLK